MNRAYLWAGGIAVAVVTAGVLTLREPTTKSRPVKFDIITVPPTGSTVMVGLKPATTTYPVVPTFDDADLLPTEPVPTLGSVPPQAPPGATAAPNVPPSATQPPTAPTAPPTAPTTTPPPPTDPPPTLPPITDPPTVPTVPPTDPTLPPITDPPTLDSLP